MAVSLDICNAFNSLLWPIIRQAVRRINLPAYLIRIVEDYLRNRWFVFADNQDQIKEMQMQARVPQGSVLGPLLWNISYDLILKEKTEKDCFFLCFANDTLIIAIADNINEAIIKTNVQVSKTLRRIRGLGLRIAAHKTGAMAFTRKPLRNEVFIRVDKEQIRLKNKIKYLGIIVDFRMKFHQHFQYITEKATKAMTALRGLMFNLRGPDTRKRKLYAHVILSILLYAAPVWSNEFSQAFKGFRKPPQNRVARILAQRVISAYKSVFLDAASMIAKLFPLDIAAVIRRIVYFRIRETRTMDALNGPSEKEIRQEETQIALRQWEGRLHSDKFESR